MKLVITLPRQKGKTFRVDLSEVGWEIVDRMHLAQDKDQELLRTP
jgi:hypothetical protein